MKRKKRYFILIILVTFMLVFMLIERKPKILLTMMGTSCDSLYVEIEVDKKDIFNDFIKNEWYRYKEIDFNSSFGKHNLLVKVGGEVLLDTSIFIMFNDNLVIQSFSDKGCKDIKLSFDNLRFRKFLFD